MRFPEPPENGTNAILHLFEDPGKRAQIWRRLNQHDPSNPNRWYQIGSDEEPKSWNHITTNVGRVQIASLTEWHRTDD